MFIPIPEFKSLTRAQKQMIKLAYKSRVAYRPSKEWLMTTYGFDDYFKTENMRIITLPQFIEFFGKWLLRNPP